MEDFSIIINFAAGSQQMVQVPSFCQGGSWAIYIEEFHADVGWRITGTTSWDLLGYRRPYFAILVDSPGKIYDTFGKPLNIMTIATPKTLINSLTTGSSYGINSLHYSVDDDSFFNMIPISNIQQFMISLVDPVDNSPLSITGNIPNQQLIISGDSHPHYWSGGFCKLRLHKLNN